MQPASSHTSSHSWSIPSFLRTAFTLPSSLPSPTPSSLLTIPTLPPLSSALPPPPSSTLVRFRGLVHDTHSSDYYLGVYRTVGGGGAGQWRTGKYRDVVRVGEGEEVDEASTRTFERMNVTLVEVPGENDWVKRALDAPTSDAPNAEPSARSARKRPMDDDAAVEADEAMTTDAESNADDSAKRSRHSANLVDALAPSSAMAARGVVVTLYDADVNALKVGDVVEVVGVYSLTPHLISDDELSSNAMHSNHHIHCLAFIRHSPTSPLLLPAPSDRDLASFSAVRSALLSHLTAVCGGDAVTAQLVLLAFISRVQSRTDDAVLGKLTVNVTHSPPSLLSALAAFTSQLLPYSMTLPITIPSLNQAPLYPLKNYDTDSLSPSPLQCRPRTLLLVDETALTEGALAAVGVRNVQALSGLLQQQTLLYDFVYHDMHMHADINAVVLSTQKSLLWTAVRVGWKAEREGWGVGEVGEEVMQRWREWVGMVTEGECVIGSDMASVVEGVFVRKRREDACCEGEWLHRVLLLSRLLAISYGERALTEARLYEAVSILDDVAAR